MTIKEEEIKVKGAKRPYEGMPAYKAGYKDAVLEMKRYHQKVDGVVPEKLKRMYDKVKK